MTEILSQNPANDKNIPPEAQPAASRGKVYFNVSRQEWVWNTIFMLSLSLTGLKMPLGNLLVVILLLRAYKINKESFVAMLTFALGGYALSSPNIHWGVNILFLLIPFSVATMCVLRKTPVLKKSIICYGVFAFVILILCFVYGTETFSGQIRTVLSFLAFCYFVIPIVSFSGESFNIHKFWHTLFSLMMIMSVFYIIDGYIIRGWVLIPCSWIDFEGNVSTWSSPIFFGPTGWIPRKYQVGLYPLALLLYPLARYYKLRWWQWLLLFGALMASRTSSLLFGLVISYILAQGTFRKYLLYGIGGIMAFTAVYFVDDSMGYSAETEQSTMRIASTINQFFALSEAEDDEDLSEAGTGRMAQALPCFEYIFQENKEWNGFGFINPNTKNPRLIVENDLVINPEFKYQPANFVEITIVKVFLSIGFIGLIAWLGFYFGLTRLIRGHKFKGYYLNVIIALLVFGMGDNNSLMNSNGILLAAMAYSAVLLANKPSSLEDFPQETPV